MYNKPLKSTHLHISLRSHTCILTYINDINMSFALCIVTIQIVHLFNMCRRKHGNLSINCIFPAVMLGNQCIAAWVVGSHYNLGLEPGCLQKCTLISISIHQSMNTVYNSHEHNMHIISVLYTQYYYKTAIGLLGLHFRLHPNLYT